MKDNENRFGNFVNHSVWPKTVLSLLTMKYIFRCYLCSNYELSSQSNTCSTCEDTKNKKEININLITSSTGNIVCIKMYKKESGNS